MFEHLDAHYSLMLSCGAAHDISVSPCFATSAGGHQMQPRLTAEQTFHPQNMRLVRDPAKNQH